MIYYNRPYCPEATFPCPLSWGGCVETWKCNYKLRRGRESSNLLFLCHTTHEGEQVLQHLASFLQEWLYSLTRIRQRYKMSAGLHWLGYSLIGLWAATLLDFCCISKVKNVLWPDWLSRRLTRWSSWLHLLRSEAVFSLLCSPRKVFLHIVICASV